MRRQTAKDRILEGHAAGLTPRQLVEYAGTTYGTVRVVLCRHGLTSPDHWRYHRGYEVPAHLRDEYLALRRLGLTMEECGYELGLVERPRLTA